MEGIKKDTRLEDNLDREIHEKSKEHLQPDRRSTQESRRQPPSLIPIPEEGGNSQDGVIPMCSGDHARAVSSTGQQQHNQTEGRIPVRRVATDHITVNGVRLVDLMKKEDSKVPRKTTKRISSPKTTRQQQQQSTPSSGKKETIMKYLVKKQADVKLTFAPVCKPGVNMGVKENIRAFQLMQKGGECRFGSGSCAEHNVKLCRKVESKRVGSVDKDGKTTWRMREVVTLVCPARVNQSSRTTTELSVHENLVGPNKKLRLNSDYDENEKYQSQPEVHTEKLKEQTPLDET